MTKMINSNNEQLLFANDAECKDRRSFLIETGAIVPANKADLVTKKDGSVVLSTRRPSRELRNNLIEQQIIDPDFQYKSGQRVRDGNLSREEGEYDPQPIKNEEEYVRRRDNYLWMISNILHVRRELKLVLGKKLDEDPDWHF